MSVLAHGSRDFFIWFRMVSLTCHSCDCLLNSFLKRGAVLRDYRGQISAFGHAVTHLGVEVVYLLALIQYPGMILPLILLVAFIFILRSICKTTKALSEAGYTMHPAPVQVPDLRPALLLAAFYLTFSLILIIQPLSCQRLRGTFSVAFVPPHVYDVSNAAGQAQHTNKIADAV